MVLPGYALMAQGTQVHVAAFPGYESASGGTRQTLLSRAFASQAAAYVMLVGGLLSADDVADPVLREVIATLPPLTGDSCIIDPTGEVIAGPCTARRSCSRRAHSSFVHTAKALCDVGGHYSRPDVLRLLSTARRPAASSRSSTRTSRPRRAVPFRRAARAALSHTSAAPTPTAAAPIGRTGMSVPLPSGAAGRLTRGPARGRRRRCSGRRGRQRRARGCCRRRARLGRRRGASARPSSWWSPAWWSSRGGGSGRRGSRRGRRRGGGRRDGARRRGEHASSVRVDRRLHLVAHVRVERVSRARGRRHVAVTGNGRGRDLDTSRPLVRTPGNERHRRARCRGDAVALREPGEGPVAGIERGGRRHHRGEVADEAHQLIEALAPACRIGRDRPGEAARTSLPTRRPRDRRGSCTRCRASPSRRCGTRTSRRGCRARGQPDGRCRRGVVHQQEPHFFRSERSGGRARRPRVARPDGESGRDGHRCQRGRTDAQPGHDCHRCARCDQATARDPRTPLLSHVCNGTHRDTRRKRMGITGPIKGGSHGWAFGGPRLDFDDYGYTSEEFFLEGTASRYQPVGRHHARSRRQVVGRSRARRSRSRRGSSSTARAIRRRSTAR